MSGSVKAGEHATGGAAPNAHTSKTTAAHARATRSSTSTEQSSTRKGSLQESSGVATLRSGDRTERMPPASGGRDGAAFGASTTRTTTTDVADVRRVTQASVAADRVRLRRGSRGESVADLQQRINRASGAKLQVDGIFGPKTARAVEQYQWERKLKVDAIVGPQTWGVLDRQAPAARSGDAPESTRRTGASARNISLKGLVPRAVQVVGQANDAGLALVSGHRSGGVAGSDHPLGKGVDVSNGSRPTAEMQAFADAIRGQPGIKYVIYNNRKASAVQNWAWRPYSYPGGPASGATARHEDHVHVSVK